MQTASAAQGAIESIGSPLERGASAYRFLTGPFLLGHRPVVDAEELAGLRPAIPILHVRPIGARVSKHA